MKDDAATGPSALEKRILYYLLLYLFLVSLVIRALVRRVTTVVSFVVARKRAVKTRSDWFRSFRNQMLPERQMLSGNGLLRW